MLKITIAEQVKTADDLADLLRHIADLVADGNTSGFYPHWSVEGTEETDDTGEGPNDWIPTVIDDASHLLPQQPHCRYCGQVDPDTRAMCTEAPASVLYHDVINPS